MSFHIGHKQTKQKTANKKFHKEFFIFSLQSRCHSNNKYFCCTKLSKLFNNNRNKNVVYEQFKLLHVCGKAGVCGWSRLVVAA